MTQRSSTTATVSTPNGEQTFHPTADQLGDMAVRLTALDCLPKPLPLPLLHGLAYDAACAVLDSGLDWAEYADGVAEYLADDGASVPHYLAESWFPGTAGNVARVGTVPTAGGMVHAVDPTDDYNRAVTAWQSVASGKPMPDPDGPDGKPADEQDSTPAAEDAPVPTATKADAVKALERYSDAYRDATEVNYALCDLAWQYALTEMGVCPGKVRVSTVVDALAAEAYKWDHRAMRRNREPMLKTLREEAWQYLRAHAVIELLGGGKARGKGQGRKQGKLMAWTTLRRFEPLVYRPTGQDDEYTLSYALIPSVADDARALFRTVLDSGLNRDDAELEVSKLMLRDATLEHTAATEAYKADPTRENGDRLTRAEQAVSRWDGTVAKREEKQAAKSGTGTKASTTPSTTPAAGKPSDKPTGDATPTTPPATAPAQPATQPAASDKPTTPTDPADDGDDDEPEGDDEPTTTPAPASDCRGVNLLQSARAAAKAAQGKDGVDVVAGMVVELVTGCEAPDDVLEAVLKTLVQHAAMSKPAHRACQAALITLTRKPTADAKTGAA